MKSKVKVGCGVPSVVGVRFGASRTLLPVIRMWRTSGTHARTRGPRNVSCTGWMRTTWSRSREVKVNDSSTFHSPSPASSREASPAAASTPLLAQPCCRSGDTACRTGPRMCLSGMLFYGILLAVPTLQHCISRDLVGCSQRGSTVIYYRDDGSRQATPG
jgi:hypothetical protein